MKKLRYAGVMAVAGLMLVAGCSKKVTKIDQATPEPAPRVMEPVPPVDEAFTARDMDARMREVLVPIYFGFDRFDLSSDAIRTLERVAKLYSEYPDLKLLAEGHCDERGSSEYNMGLGEKRARAIRDWLVAYGISSSGIEVTSFGKEKLAVSNCQDEQCHSRNRRAEWKVLKQPVVTLNR